MDLITDLPLVNSYDSVLVVVDRFTKMAHFTPCSKTISGEGMAYLLLNNVVCLHGLPEMSSPIADPNLSLTFGNAYYKL